MDLIKKGKKIVVGIIIAFLIIELFEIITFSYIYAVTGNMNSVVAQLVRGAFRLILECTIFFFLYKGHIWAKNLMIGLLLIGGIFGFASALGSGLHFLNIIMIALCITFLVFAIILMKSESIKCFLSFQKNGVKES